MEKTHFCITFAVAFGNMVAKNDAYVIRRHVPPLYPRAHEALEYLQDTY